MGLPSSKNEDKKSSKNTEKTIIRKVLELLVALALYAMVMFVFINAVLRYVFKSGWSLSEEMSRWMFVWATFLGTIIAFVEGKHIGVDLVLNVLGRRGRFVLALIGKILVSAILVLIVHGAWLYFLRTANVPAPSSRLPQGLLTVSLLLASIAMLGLSLYQIVQFIRTYNAEGKEEEN